MAIEQPTSTDTLDSPDHSLLHRIIAADVAAPVKSLIVDANANIGFSTETFGTNAAKAIGIAAGTAPTSSPADAVQLWCADRNGVAGQAGLHIRSEDGTTHCMSDEVSFGVAAGNGAHFYVYSANGQHWFKNGAVYIEYGSAYKYLELQQTANYGYITNSYGNLFLNATGHITTQAAKRLGVGKASNTPDQMLEIEETETITGAVTDGYAATLQFDPGYTAATAQTVTRHNYINVQDVSVAGAGPATVTDACLLRFDAALGTHKATTNADKTGNANSGTIKVNVNGTIYHIQLYADS